MHAARTFLVLAAAATLTACSGDAASPLEPAGEPAVKSGVGYFGTGNRDGDTTTTSSTDDGSTSTERGVGYLGTGN